MPRLHGVRLHQPRPPSARPSPRGGPRRACPACGYDLRGIIGAVCPECGREQTSVRATFRTAYWNVPPFYIGAVGLIAAFAPALYAAGVILTAANFDFTGADLADRFNLFILIAWGAGLVSLGIAWINWSGTMAAWPRLKHWLVAAACWLLPAAGVGVAHLMKTLP